MAATFSQETFDFFVDIRFHNETAYYIANKERYLRDVQAPFYALIEDLAPAMLKIDPRMEVRPYRCLARLRRDTRFTKDKAPYRDHLWITFHRAGEKREGSVMFWFELGIDRIGWGMGTWGENRAAMDLLRKRLAAAPDDILKPLRRAGIMKGEFAVSGSTFKRLSVPDTVPESLRTLYKARELYFSRPAPRMTWVQDGTLVKRIEDDFKKLAPLYRLLRGLCDDAHTEESEA